MFVVVVVQTTDGNRLHTKMVSEPVCKVVDLSFWLCALFCVQTSSRVRVRVVPPHPCGSLPLSAAVSPTVRVLTPLVLHGLNVSQSSVKSHYRV